MESTATVAVLGYGRFGRSLSALLQDAGRRVLAFDPEAEVPEPLRAGSVETLLAGSGPVILAVPLSGVREAIHTLRAHLRPEHLVIDVGSVKHGPIRAMTEVLGEGIPWVATHPLFGPASIARGDRPLRVVVCPNELHPGAAGEARYFYEGIGCRVVEQSAEAHDRVMADTHVLAFFVAKGMLETGVDEAVPFAPPSFQAMAQTIEEVRGDAGHLFFPIEKANPFAAEARERLLDALARIHRQLAEAGEASSAPPRSLAIPAPSGTAPELRETRELIDELDEQLVRLLARRARLSCHAARVKAAQGKPVQDPAREQSLLAQRRAWAEEWELAPETVADVFESILRFSRSEQRRWLRDSLTPPCPRRDS